MKAALLHLTATDSTDADKVDALLRLRDLVRPIDNANGGCCPLCKCTHAKQRLKEIHASSVGSNCTPGLSSPRTAADLKAVHGIEPLVAALDSDNTDVRAAAADVLGTAASNNVRVQQDVADVRPDIVQKLLQVCSRN